MWSLILCNTLIPVPPEPSPERSLGSRSGHRIRRSTSHAIASTTEAHGAACEEKKDESGKSHPESRSCVGGTSDAIKFLDFVSQERKQCDVDGEGDKCKKGSQEGGQRRHKGHGDVRREREKECDEDNGSCDGVHRESAGPRWTNYDIVVLRRVESDAICMSCLATNSIPFRILAMSPDTQAALSDRVG